MLSAMPEGTTLEASRTESGESGEPPSHQLQGLGDLKKSHQIGVMLQRNFMKGSKNRVPGMLSRLSLLHIWVYTS